MNSLELLLTRQSNPFLTAPAPNQDELKNILKAGMKAPDHGGLMPWHFTVITGKGLDTLSQLFIEVTQSLTDDESKIAKAGKMPYRAPMIIVISTKYQQHTKVPQIEQSITAGCAAHAMQMAAFAQGLGAMWRTGELSYHDAIKAGLNIDSSDDIIGFLYIGSISKELAPKPTKNYASFTSYL
jgi:nitroreductase